MLSGSAEPLLTIARNKVNQNTDMNDDKSPIQPDSTPLRNIVDREAPKQATYRLTLANLTNRAYRIRNHFCNPRHGRSH